MWIRYSFKSVCSDILLHFLTGSFTGAINGTADYLALNKQYFAAGYTTSYLQRKKHLRPMVD